MKIACIGDSFVQGYGVAESQRWTSLLEEQSGQQVINLGINGDTTGGMLARFPVQVPAEKPRLVLLSGGFNDCLCLAPVGAAAANLMAMIHQAFSYGVVPAAVICPHGEQRLFEDHWPATIDYPVAAQLFESYRQQILQLCRSFSVLCIDLYELAEAFPPEEIYLDGIHLNEKGHRLVAEEIKNALTAQRFI